MRLIIVIVLFLLSFLLMFCASCNRTVPFKARSLWYSPDGVGNISTILWLDSAFKVGDTLIIEYKRYVLVERVK